MPLDLLAFEFGLALLDKRIHAFALVVGRKQPVKQAPFEPHSFGDVDPESYADPYIAVIAALEITTGTSPGE